MKKKVFSKLLMGALLVASVSSFTSCKDYDDDINDLRSQINGLNTSLNATVTDKLATVTNQVTTLSAQLNEVKTAYATADAALQKAIDAAEATGTVNTANINALQQELVNLSATDANLTQAIAKLQEGQDAAALLLSAQSLSITELAATDKALETAIAAAQAQADNALAEAKKAQETAANNYTALSALIGANNTAIAEANKEIANLQKQISDNLASVNAKIADEIAKLDARIKTNETNIAKLQESTAANGANITTINTKLAELAATDKSISDALDAAKTKLADDQKTAVENLQKQITANASAIQTINEKTVEDLAKHVIPDEVNKQLAEALPEALKDYMKTEDILALVGEKEAAAKTLIEALQAKHKADSTALKNYVDGEFLLAVQTLIGNAISASEEKTAGEWSNALTNASQALNNDITAINEKLDPEKEGSLANTLKAAQVALGTDVATLQKFFQAEDGDALSIDNLVAQIAGTTGFANAMKDAADEANGEILGMITSINLFAGVHENAHQNTAGSGYDAFNHTLTFTYTIEKANVFPNDEGQKFVGDKIEFTEGKFRTYTDSILVRVSPVDAKLTAENITLINSQVKDLVAEGVVEVTDVKRYVSETPLTRAAENSGLWVISFKLVDGDIADKFEEAAFAEVNGQQKSIVYAVAAKNTKANRYVVSEYDLDLATAPAYHAWNFDVNEKTVANIHNRYVWTEDGPGYQKVQTDDAENINNHLNTFRPELTYVDEYNLYNITNAGRNNTYNDAEGNTLVADYPGFTYAQFNENDTINRYNHTIVNNVDGIDNRQLQSILNVGFNYTDDEGEWAKIDIVFPAQTTAGISTPIAGFYVTLDQEFALESASSEINSWVNYVYKNVGFYYVHNGKLDATRGENGYVKGALQKGNAGAIYVKNANNVKGDIIGFRVYAVNLDGTLYDPDGRAFYVKIGDKVDEQKLTFHVLATEQYTSNALQDTVNGKNPIIAYNETNTLNFFNIDEYAGNAAYVNWTWAAKNKMVRTPWSNFVPTEGTSNSISTIFTFRYTDDAEITDATVWGNRPTAKTKNVKVTLNDAQYLLDDETYYLTATVNQPDASNTNVIVLNTINVEVTKVMPTDLPEAFGVKAGLVDRAKDMKFYLRPIADPNTWSIANWFDATEEDFGKSWIDENAGATAKQYRWATDARPYNFEEIFTGLDLYPSQHRDSRYDKNYVFEFPTCGKYADDLNGINGDARATFNNNNFTYLGLKADSTDTETKMPGYYLPNVKYAVLDKYGKADAKLAVKAGYTYRGVSFKFDEANNAYVTGDFEVKPQYFDANGKFVTDATKAAFQCYFDCAIDEKFTANIGIKVPYLWNPTIVGGVAQGFTIAANADNKGTTSDKYVPYGIGFTVELDSIGATWVSNLAALTTGDKKAYAASYFNTKFDTFTAQYTPLASGKSYYTDTLAVKGVDLVSTNNNMKTNKGAGAVVDYVKIIDIADPVIAKAELEYYGADGKKASKNLDITANIKDYFEITYLATEAGAGVASKYGIKFIPRADALDPAKHGQLIITLKSDATLIHQWGHKTSLSNGDGVKVYYGKPLSTDNLSRRR